MELMMTVVLVGILVSMGVPLFHRAAERTRCREAESQLEVIQHAERVQEMETNVYLPCGDTAACNVALNLNMPTQDWDYSVVINGAGTGGVATADRLGVGHWQNCQYTIAIPNGDPVITVMADCPF